MADEEQLAILKQGVDVWNEWRKLHPKDEIDLTGTFLEGIHLEGIHLEGVYLFNANLREATLDGAFLVGADLSGSNLGNAHLSGAYLGDANLGRADLSSAILTHTYLHGAYLVGANLCWADISYADLSGAVFGATILGDTDMSDVQGIEWVRHYAPSPVDVNTLLKSKPRLPDKFLRDCGVPEIFIENLPYMLNNAIDFYSCFISYSHADQAFARRVHDTLQGRGIRCWLDEKQMNPGDDIYEEVHRGIRYWDKVLLCCSKSSLSEKWWVDQEINKAFQKECDLMKDRGEKVLALIPLNLDGYLFSPEYTGAKGDEIRSRLAADFTGWEHDNAIFERGIEQVIKALRTDGGHEPPPKPRL